MKKLLAVLAVTLIAAATLSAADKPLVVVWYPNNSGEDWKAARQAVDDLIAKATGRQVIDRLTTDYVIAIEAIATGNAAICYPGAVGYIQASQKNPHVVPLVTKSSSAGTLDDSVYYSRIAVRTADAPKYMKNGAYAIDAIKGKTMSFVSSSSTSGFVVPSTVIKSYFAGQMGWKDDKVEDLFLQGGSGQFFSQVLFGQSHQGSIYNVLSGKADVCAVDDIDVDKYFDLTSGKANTPGAVYVTRTDAAAPFDTVPGTSFTVIASSTVREAPIVVNTDLVPPAMFKALRAAFTSDATANNPKIFVPADAKDANGKPLTGLWKKTGKERFIAVDAPWYDDIRQLMK
ncbi:MAG TPA: PhnD/SsuA/transferrin family substrate-binding protein [Spirochaetia bacterium]